jgi:hypothetical protein
MGPLALVVGAGAVSFMTGEEGFGLGLVPNVAALVALGYLTRPRQRG